STVRLFGYEPESYRQSPERSGLPATRGAGALVSSFPSAVRGTFGVLSLNHCASACTHVRTTTAPAAAMTLKQRDIDKTPFFDDSLVRRYPYIPVRLRQARDFSRPFECRKGHAVLDSHGVELQ